MIVVRSLRPCTNIIICHSFKTFTLTFVGIVVDQNQTLRFAIDIARGMEFLHSMEPMVPNMVLTSRHVMVSVNP